MCMYVHMQRPIDRLTIGCSYKFYEQLFSFEFPFALRPSAAFRWFIGGFVFAFMQKYLPFNFTLILRFFYDNFILFYTLL